MNSRTTLVLLILALVVTALAWRDARNTDLHFQKDLDQPFDFPDASVLGLGMVRADARIELARDESGAWRLVAPVDFPAELPAVETLVRTVRELRVRGEGRESSVPPDAPTITLRVRGRSDVTIAFGEEHPTLPYVNARLPEGVVLIDPLLSELVESVTPDDLRDSAICDIPLTRAVALEVVRGEDRWAVERVPGGPWELVAPTRADADPAAVSTAIETLNAWGIHSYVEDGVTEESALARHGLSPPRIAIAVEERGTGRVVRLRVGAPVDLPEGGGAGVLVYLEESRAVVRATAAALARLPEGADSLRSRRLVRVPQPDIVELTVVGDYRRVGFSRGDDRRWRLVWSGDGGAHVVEPGVLETMLESLRGATVERFVPLDRDDVTPYGFDRPSLDLSLLRAGGETERLIVGRGVDDEPGSYFVWNERWDEVGIAYFPDLVRWRRAPFSLRALPLVPVPPDALRRVRVTDAAGRSVSVIRPYRTWQRGDGRTPGAAPEPLAEDVARALDALPALLADRWVPDPDDPPGPDAAALTVEILPTEGDDPAPWIRLLVSAERAGGARLVRDGDDGWVARVASPDPFAPLERLLAP